MIRIEKKKINPSRRGHKLHCYICPNIYNSRMYLMSQKITHKYCAKGKYKFKNNIM